MEDIQQYFTKQEEEISNTYMNVNGEGTTHTMPDGSVMPGATHTEGYGNIFTQKKLLDRCSRRCCKSYVVPKSNEEK